MGMFRGGDFGVISESDWDGVAVAVGVIQVSVRSEGDVAGEEVQSKERSRRKYGRDRTSPASSFQICASSRRCRVSLSRYL